MTTLNIIVAAFLNSEEQMLAKRRASHDSSVHPTYIFIDLKNVKAVCLHMLWYKLRLQVQVYGLTVQLNSVLCIY